MEQHVQYCKTPDDVRIAYAVTGSGPPLVWIPGWVSHLDLEWASPEMRALFEMLSSRLTLVRHDKRGTGLSSWKAGDYSLESSVGDVELLVEHLGLERFAIGGLSEGGPVATLYAARHPERVTKLVIYGSYACGEGVLTSPEMREAVRLLVKTQWGVASKLMAAIFLGEDAFMTPEVLAATQMASAAPEEALALLDRALNVDIRDVLGQIASPTLVIHHRHDMAVPIELGQEVAAGIKGARFITGPGSHLPSRQALKDVALAVLSFVLEEEVRELGGYRDDDPTAPVPPPAAAYDAMKASRSPLYSDGRLRIDPEAHVVALDGEPVDLSPTEFNLLVALAAAPGRVHRYDELLQRVWGPEYIGETDFLHVYVSRLRKKLGQRVITTERGFGYRFAAEGDQPDRDMPSGTAVILFVDIADSTGLTEKMGDAAFRKKARNLDGTLRAAIRDSGGTAVDGKLLGDGVLAVFTSARDAIEAAAACGEQGKLAGLPVHLGMHAGDVIWEENNVYGGAVNIASRIAAHSEPGEVLVSETVRSLARTSAGVRFEDRGEQALKGVGETVRVWAVCEGTTV